MATTTVTGHGRHSSMRQPELQMPNKMPTSQPTSSPIDKFPPYEESLDAAMGASRPNASPSVRYAPSDLWEPRKSSFYAREHPNGAARVPKHRPRKSISEALTTIRARNGSVSANAQELAEALRAPVSYRLIVCCTPGHHHTSGVLANEPKGSLHRVVFDLRPHEHVLQIHSERFTNADHFNNCPIRIRFGLVPTFGIPVDGDAMVTTERTGP